MKPEPLKGKISTFGGGPTYDTVMVKDIRAAVEWLRLEDVKSIRLYNFKEITWGDLNRQLDRNREKAFEDVMK